MARRVVLGVDSSTQSVKVVAHDADTFEVLATASAPHPPTHPPVSEQDPRSWWSALVDAVGQLGDIRSDVVGISVGGQQHGLVLLDAAGDPVRPAKLWNDTTSAPQAATLTERLLPIEWANQTGSVPVAAFTITKLSWVAENEPDTLERVAHVMLPHDYLTWRLSGEFVTDRGDASGTGWFDPVGNAYVGELMAMVTNAGWVELLPRVLGPNQAAGSLVASVAAELGLPQDIVVGPGTGDNMAAALGLGLQPGDTAISLGTSGTVYTVSETPTHDATGSVAGFASACGRFLPLVCTLNATKVTDTVARWLGTDAAGLAQLALQADPATVDRDPVLIPYFDGERTPNLPDATGTWTGLTNEVTREQLARSAHDGVLRGLLAGRDALRSVGAPCDGRLFLVGGGSRSAAYRERLAALAGTEIVVPDVDEAVATGAAQQARNCLAL